MVFGRRLLRDYSKPSSNFEWQFISKIFYDNSLYPTHPLELWSDYDDNYLKAKNSCIASLLLLILANNIITKDQYNYINKFLCEGYMDMKKELRVILNKIWNENAKKGKKNFRSLIEEDALTLYKEFDIISDVKLENARKISLYITRYL